MIPVEMISFYDVEAETRGDCMRACMASLLELPRDEVPHFAGMGDEWWTAWMNFMAERGWTVTQWSCPSGPNEPPSQWRDGYWLGVVRSPRIVLPNGNAGSHMVVMNGREIAWDPHPERDGGHLGFIEGYVLVALDPARFVLRAA